MIQRTDDLRRTAIQRLADRSRPDSRLFPRRLPAGPRVPSPRYTISPSRRFGPTTQDEDHARLYTAANGMMAQELNVEVISNNVANLRTTGSSASGVHFQDLMTSSCAAPARRAPEQNTQIPVGVFVGSGVKTVSTPRLMARRAT